VTILRLLNPQGIAGIVAGLALAILLVIQKGETRHWQKSSEQFEQLYGTEQAAFAGTVANYRAAADAARAADAANAGRVKAEQDQINKEQSDEFEARIADARARALRLRLETDAAAANPGVGRTASVSRVPSASGGADQAAGEGRLPPADALIATEQAIQLDELIRWLAKQQAVDPNAAR
jgi:hypothetical protein